jgi:High-affinity nickel-transport protein
MVEDRSSCEDAQLWPDKGVSAVSFSESGRSRRLAPAHDGARRRTLPLLFAAGMSLMDTADGALMSHAYGWAFSHPIRKVYYNLTVTSLSVAVALIGWRDSDAALVPPLLWTTREAFTRL